MTPPFRIGVAGLGTVGGALVEEITRSADLISRQCGRKVQITGISARTRHRARSFDATPFAWFDDPVALAQADTTDLFVELIGGEEGIARAAVEAALDAGKHVVSANKALLAHHGAALAQRAERRRASLGFEAAVAGGIPVIAPLQDCFVGERAGRIYGILNGTCNYILSRMERENLAFDDCLAEAQKLGYAEAEPGFDIDGYDTAHKLAILCSLAFGNSVDLSSVYIEGIRAISPVDIRAADELGYRIRLLGVAQRTESGVEQRVHPALVPKTSFMAWTTGVSNAVAVDLPRRGKILFAGPGAGGNATAAAALADIARAACGRTGPAFGLPAGQLGKNIKARMRAHEGGCFIRLSVKDRPGTLAAIASAFAAHDISLESIVQRARKASASAPAQSHPGELQPVVVITYPASEATIRAAFADIIAADVLVDDPRMIRIETLS